MRVAVTGAAGQIGYALLFRVASGQMLGPEEKIDLRLLEIPDAVKAAEATARGPRGWNVRTSSRPTARYSRNKAERWPRAPPKTCGCWLWGTRTTRTA